MRVESRPGDVISVLKTVVATIYWPNEAWREANYMSFWKNFVQDEHTGEAAAETLRSAAKLPAHTGASLPMMSRYGALPFQSRRPLRRTP